MYKPSATEVGMRTPMVMMAGTALAACGESEPRSLEYFEKHPHEARAVIEDCESGVVRGAECGNAGTAVATAEARERFKRFRGK